METILPALATMAIVFTLAPLVRPLVQRNPGVYTRGDVLFSLVGAALLTLISLGMGTSPVETLILPAFGFAVVGAMAMVRSVALWNIQLAAQRHGEMLPGLEFDVKAWNEQFRNSSPES